MKKKLPKLKSDKEAESFVKNADVEEYDLSSGKRIRFEFQKKDKAVHVPK